MEFPRMEFGYNGKHLIIYNSSGSIMSYAWKMANDECEGVSAHKPCSIDHQYVDDNNISDGLSLEQQKQFEQESNRKIRVQLRKMETLEKIAKLKNEFVAIKDRNGKLPEKYQLPPDAFELDKRIIDDLEWRTNEKFKVIQAELQRKIDRIRAQAERMEHIYLDNLEHWPIIITGFRYVIRLLLLIYASIT